MICQKLKTYMESGRVVFLPARSIRPNPAQPRKQFQPESLEQLTLSIRQHGILQPLSVRRAGAYYELIAGERRLRAAIAAGLTEIPCIVMQMTDTESGLTALVENLQRQDLTYLEQARSIRLLMEQFTLSQEQVAELLGLSQSAIANKLRLLKLPAQVLERLADCSLTERHARALLKLPEEEAALQVIDLALKKDWTVARTEQYINTLIATSPPAPRTGDIGRFLRQVGATLTRFQSDGIAAISERRETEKEIVLTITIPKT